MEDLAQSAAAQPSHDADTVAPIARTQDEKGDLPEYEAMARKLDNSKIKRLLAKLRPIQAELERSDPDF